MALRVVGGFVALCLALSVGACGPSSSAARSAVAPPPRLPEAKARAPRPPPRPEWFWEAVDADVHGPARKPADLPIAEVARVEGASKYWDDLPVEARERLKRDGILVVGDAPDVAVPAPATTSARQFVSMGAFYTDLREQRVPHIVTIDALYSLVHLAFARAVAEIEETDLAPLLQSVIEKIDARLKTEEAGVGTELGDAYRVARGVMGVARSLATATGDAPDARLKTPAQVLSPRNDLTSLIERERALIDAHAGPALSPVLGISIDYARFVAPSTSARPQLQRAMMWLGTAPFTLGGKSEASGAAISLHQARIHARAAMLLARLCTKDIDATTNAAYTRLVRLSTFLYGPPDDLSLTELDEIATGVGVDLTKPENIANVARVDKVRTKALAGRVPAVYDASGIGGRAGTSARVFGGHASIDSLVMQSLVGPAVGAAQEAAASAPVDRLRQGLRVLPSTVDLAAWFGSKEARVVLRETKADAFDSFDAVLASLQKNRPSDQQPILHASVYGSMIDSLVAYAAVNENPNVKISSAAERARVESLLTAWTLARHAGVAFSRPKPLPPPAPAELKVSGAPLAVFVEPMPDVVARQVATVRQLRRGLSSLASLPSNSAVLTMLVEVEDMLRAALKGAEKNANDEALTTEEAAALASLPARLARIEEESSIDHGPAIAVVYSDPPSKRLLASATGKIEPVLMLAREAGKEEQMLVIGAHVAHHEVIDAPPTTATTPRAVLTDASWRARLKAAGPGAGATAGATTPPVVRAEWTAPFRFVKPAAPMADKPAQK